HSLSGRVNQHGRRTVDNISGRNLLVTVLENFILANQTVYIFSPINGKDRSDRYVEIDIGRAVQRIHTHHILTGLYRVFFRYVNPSFMFFRSNITTLATTA